LQLIEYYYLFVCFDWNIGSVGDAIFPFGMKFIFQLLLGLNFLLKMVERDRLA